MSKGSEAENTITKVFKRTDLNLWENHQKKAFEVIFLSNDELQNMSVILFGNLENSNIEDTARLGIMSKGGGNADFKFVHRTFAEFFVANFITNQLSNPHIKSNENFFVVMEVLAKLLKHKRDFEMVLKFLDSSLSNHNIDCSSEKTNNFESKFKILLNDYSQTILPFSEKTIYVNLLRVFTERCISNYLRMFRLWLHNKNYYTQTLFIFMSRYQQRSHESYQHCQKKL